MSYHIRPIRQLPDNTRIFAGLLAIQTEGERIRLNGTSHWRQNFCRILYRFPGEQMEKKPMEAIPSTCGTKMEIKWISVSPLSAKIVLSSSIKAGKNLNTVSASKFPTTRKCLLPLHWPDIIYKKSRNDRPAMLYTNLHAMVNLYMTEKHGISYLPDILNKEYRLARQKRRTVQTALP